jgi:hypothetical protein
VMRGRRVLVTVSQLGRGHFEASAFDPRSGQSFAVDVPSMTKAVASPQRSAPQSPSRTAKPSPSRSTKPSPSRGGMTSSSSSPSVLGASLAPMAASASAATALSPSQVFSQAQAAVRLAELEPDLVARALQALADASEVDRPWASVSVSQVNVLGDVPLEVLGRSDAEPAVSDSLSRTLVTSFRGPHGACMGVPVRWSVCDACIARVPRVALWRRVPLL